MPRFRRSLVLPLLAAALALPATSQTALAQTGPVTVQLSEQNDSNIDGTATLTAMGQQTRVVIAVDDAGAGPQPAHIHNGTCATLDPRPAYPLTPVANGRSETMVNAALSEILSRQTAINLHKSPQEAAVYVACGNLPVQAAARAQPAQLPRTGQAEFGLYGLAAIGALLAAAGARLTLRRRQG